MANSNELPVPPHMRGTNSADSAVSSRLCAIGPWSNQTVACGVLAEKRRAKASRLSKITYCDLRAAHYAASIYRNSMELWRVLFSCYKRSVEIFNALKETRQLQEILPLKGRDAGYLTPLAALRANTSPCTRCRHRRPLRTTRDFVPTMAAQRAPGAPTRSCPARRSFQAP
jgi:hypothetical protein